MRSIKEGEGRSAVSTPIASSPIPRKLYRSGEIIEHTRISRQTLHTYTLLGLITEERATMAGHRLYDESVFERLIRIQQMKKEKKTLREIRGILDAEEKEFARREGKMEEGTE